MRIEIQDVDHGACITLTGPTGHRLMLDCGQSLSRPWFPSVEYFGQFINTLMIQNLDEDHVEDLADLWAWTRIGGFFSNPTVPAWALLAMKTQGMRRGVQKAHDILLEKGPWIANWDDGLGGIAWRSFWNRYGTDFTDTNNLSLATFVTFGSFKMLYGGDLETAGWRKLMERPEFRACLPSLDVFVASHHGRESGQCAELFDWCSPKLIVFSDGPKQYESQETSAWYGARATGILDWTRPRGLLGQPLRKVMTTRSDGTIQIDVLPNGNWNVHRNPRPMAVPTGLGGLAALGEPYLRNKLLG